MGAFTSLSSATETCENARRFLCQVARPSLDLFLNVNTTYLLFVQPTMLNVTGALELIVHRRRPPSNSLCTNATIIDPIGATSLVMDDNKFAVYGTSPTFPKTSPCFTSIYSKLYWYKITNTLSTQISIDIHVELTKDSYGVSFAILQGGSCGSLQCVQGMFEEYTGSNDFIAKPHQSYIIFVQPYSKGLSNITFFGRTQFFSIVHPKTGTAIQLLSDIDYYAFSASKVNIQALFPLIPEQPIRSVRMTYDNPRRIVCDQRIPYSVFGDIRGEYNNATLQLGQHKVTATPFALPNCTGEPGMPMSQEFRVTGCATEFVINRYTLVPSTSEIASVRGFYRPTKLPLLMSLPCKVNVAMTIQCGFPLRTTNFELRNATTGELILTDKEKLLGLAYGVTTYNLRKHAHFAKGSYSIRAIINGVTHPSINFTVVNSTCAP